MLKCRFLILVFLLLLGSQNVFAQAPHWVKLDLPNNSTGSIKTYQSRLFMFALSDLFFTDNDGISWTIQSGLHSEYVPLKMLRCDTTLFVQHSSGYFLDRSTNGGSTWDSVIGYGNYFFASSKGLFYTKNPNEFYFTSLDGATQFQINKDALGVITRFVTAKDNYIVYLTDSVWGYGRIYTISTDLGKTWHNINYPGDGEEIYIIGDLFFSAGSKGIYRSTDTCNTWMLIDSNIRMTSSYRELYFLGNQNTIFVAADSLGIFYSSDSGLTWTPMNDGLSNFKFGYFTSSTNELYVGFTNGEIYHTTFSSAVKSYHTRKSNCSIYPNPLTSEGSIIYSLPSHSTVSLIIYDALGRIVATPISEQPQDAGEHSVSFDAKALTPGVYHCRLIAGSEESVVKFLKQ